jgi:hypothetical protein
VPRLRRLLKELIGSTSLETASKIPNLVPWEFRCGSLNGVEISRNPSSPAKLSHQANFRHHLSPPLRSRAFWEKVYADQQSEPGTREIGLSSQPPHRHLDFWDVESGSPKTESRGL